MKVFPLLFPLATAVPAAALTPPTDLIYGHYEINIDYQPVTSGNPDLGWIFTASYDEDDDFSSAAGLVRLDSETTRFLAAPNNIQTIPNPAGVFSRFGPPGTPIWILPQDNILGSNFLGIRTTMPPNKVIFQTRVGNNYSPQGQGTISLRLVSVIGTGADAGGKFATWKTESLGNSVFSFDTTDGITAADEIPTIPVYSHTHYNWGMTKPGNYQVTFEAKAKLLNGTFTSAQKTFTFMIPFSGRVVGGGQLRAIVGSSGKPQIAVADPAGGVGYQRDRAMVEAPTAATSASAALPGAQWEVPLSISSAAGSFPNGVGVPPELLAAGIDNDWSQVVMQLVDVRGPGKFALISAGGTVLAGDFDGIDASDSIPVSFGSNTAVTAGFTAAGIYRAKFVVRGTRGGQEVIGEPVSVTFGAGINATFDYAAWQSNFEKTGGLAAGTLADRNGDYDQDGIINGVEFAFFWQGMDPTRSDATLMPKAFPAPEGFGVVEFLRDTWKDPFDETKWQIRAETSPDLKSWTLRSARVPGFPLGVFETGAEEGNAIGPVMQRRLRVPSPGNRAFFRFRVTPR